MKSEIRNLKSEIRTIPRIHWLDSLKGILVLMMIVYHCGFDLSFFFKDSVDLSSTPWILLARLVQFGFLTAVGLSLHLSFKRAPDYSVWLKRMEIRALKLFGIAMAITLATWVVMPEAFIRFGILHLISVSILVGALVIPSAAITGASLLLSFLLGLYFSGLETFHTFFIPFGLAPGDYFSYDYFPIFPWVSVVLAGMLLARGLDHYSWLKNPHWLGRFQALEKIGQHSLLIYLLHQPILLGGLWLFLRLR